MCVEGGGKREEEEDSEQQELNNGLSRHSGLFGLIIGFLLRALTSPAIFYYYTTTFKYLFLFSKITSFLAPL